jgi:hypothetical protein
MNNLKQVTWIASAEKRMANLERLDKESEAIKDKQIWVLNETIALLEKRIEALEAKRGPGRPKVERNFTRDN